MEDKKTVKQLWADGNKNLLQIITHNEIVHMIKNQDPAIKTIFNEETLSIILSYLNQEHPLDPNNPELSYKLPHSAMEIMSCESHHITDLIFQSQRDSQTKQQSGGQIKSQSPQLEKQKEKKHLVKYLLSFLSYKQHYYLAGLFSKVVGSVTKRVFAPSHKYNQLMCDIIFGQQSNPQENRPVLLQTLNHIYSECINELVVRWLTLKSKDSSYRKAKQLFIETALAILNTPLSEFPSHSLICNFGEQSLQSIISLLLLLLKSPLEPVPDKPHQEQKNINLLVNKNAQKQLYEMLAQQKFIHSIMQPIPNPRTHKLIMIRKIMEKMRSENQQIQKMEDQYRNLHLADVLTDEMMIECLSWVNQNLLTLAACIQYENNEVCGEGEMFVNDDCENASTGIVKVVSKQSLQKVDKKYLLTYLQLLHEFHLHASQLREVFTYWYEEKAKQQVEMLLKFLRLKNNLVSSQLTKIITIALTKFKCPDFSTFLLHHGISQLIDEEGIREHVLGWANIVLENKSQKSHIFENIQEESKWDHMAEIITEAQQIVMGRYRHSPSPLDFFYSLEKARDNYADFIIQPIVIEYEDRAFLPKKVESEKEKQKQLSTQPQEAKSMATLKKKMSSPPVFGERIKDDNKLIGSSIQENVGSEIESIGEVNLEQEKEKMNMNIKDEQQQKLQSMDVLGIDSIRQGYLKFELPNILHEMQQ